MGPVDLESAAFFEDPGPTLARLRDEDPVHFHAPLGAYVLTRYDDVSRALRASSLSVGRGGAIARCPVASVRAKLDECNRAFAGWMVFSDPPRHGRLRDRVASAFTPARVRRLRPTIEAVARELVDALRASPGPHDLVASYASPLPARVTAALLGIPREALAQLESATDEVFAFFGATAADAPTVERAHASLVAMRAFFEDELEARRVAPRDDLLTVLATGGEADPPLDDDDLVGLAMTLVAGAFGTTTHLVASAVYALLTQGSAWAELVGDPSLAPLAVEEALRFDGPALAVQRRTTRELDLGGHAIPAGARIYCMLHAANHDPTAFEDPARFDLRRRSPRQHLGLGAGAHFCLGASLTRLETEIALATLAERAPTLALAGDAPRHGSMAMRGLVALPVRVR